jgi:hypothetical protein
MTLMFSVSFGLFINFLRVDIVTFCISLNPVVNKPFEAAFQNITKKIASIYTIYRLYFTIQLCKNAL